MVVSAGLAGVQVRLVLPSRPRQTAGKTAPRGKLGGPGWGWGGGECRGSLCQGEASFHITLEKYEHFAHVLTSFTLALITATADIN